MDNGFRRGDVVYTNVAGGTKGFAAVMQDQVGDPLLELHRGGYERYFYLHAGWCRKIGRVGEDVLTLAEAANEEIKALDAEREERRKEYEASEARKAEQITEKFEELSDKYKAEVARAIRAFDAYAQASKNETC